jgi:hypothetical protein
MEFLTFILLVEGKVDFLLWDSNDSVTTLSQEEIKLNESYSNISKLNDEIQSEEKIAQEKQLET